VRGTPKRLGQFLPPRVELRPVGRAGPCPHRQIERKLALFGHADLVGASEPTRRGADVERAVCRARHMNRREDSIILLVNVVHQVRDLEPSGNRIAQRSDGQDFRQLPLHVHWQARVARVEPISVPSGFRAHVDRDLDGAAGRRRSLRHQFGRDVLRGRQRRPEEEHEEEQQPAHEPRLIASSRNVEA